MYNDAKTRNKSGFKEKITEGYPGEVYQGICRCVDRNVIQVQYTCNDLVYAKYMKSDVMQVQYVQSTPVLTIN